jgi:hypothetical protein
LTGQTTSFTDTDGYDKEADGGNYPKRIYCIAIITAGSNDQINPSTFQCSVGLSLDGMPADFGIKI